MKPNQQHKDPQITNISFNNFTGSISIITPLSDNEQPNDLMLSSHQTNAGVDIFKPNHHLSLITQPVLGARSRKKDKIDSITNSRRNSINDSSSLIFPINRTEKFHNEKKSNHHESSDSGLDFSLSTNSSVQYQQQHTIIHRPLSALNEDSDTDDGFHEQPTHQHRSLNDLTNEILPTPHTIIQKQNKPLRKKPKLNIIIEPSSPSSSRLSINNEQIHPIPQTTNNSSNQQIKPKAITPLGNYPNQEQIRAHINRSVIERQHPSYLSVPPRKGIIQQPIPFDASPSKVNNLLFRQQKQLNPNIQTGGSTIQNLHIPPSRQTKQILPSLFHEETTDDRRKEKKRLNDINKWQENSQKEQVRIKVNDIQESLKPKQKYENQQNQINNFLTSTPRRNYKHGTILKKENINRRQQPINQTYRSKFLQNKNRVINPNTEFESNPIVPFQSRPRKLMRISNIQNQTEQIYPINPRRKSPTESINNLLRTTRIQPMNINNRRQEDELNRSRQKNTSRLFQVRSPTSWSIISDNQTNHYELSSSSSSPHNELINDKSTHTYRVILIDEQQQQLLDGRYVIPFNKSQLPVYVDSSSQTSSHHTYPFICSPDSNNNKDIPIENSPRELIDHRSCSSSSLDRFSPNNRFPLPLGKVTIAMEEDDISTNYDSDDGWSDDSAELIYVDERYKTQKKKNIPPSSSKLISQHQKNVLLQ